MDPVGPWSAYSPYNRLAGVQTTSAGTDIHHLSSPANAVVSASTTQILSGSFLTPAGYETVFSPLFHPGGAKPASHYAATQHSSTRQKNDGDFHQTQFFDQTAGSWPQNSPFGILPHEVVSTTNTKTSTFDSFNPHYSTSLNHAATSKSSAGRHSPTTKSTSSTSFYQPPTTFQSTDNSSNKPYPVITNTANLQSCIVTTPSDISKDYRSLQNTARAPFLATAVNRTVEKSYSPQLKSAVPTLPTKPRDDATSTIQSQGSPGAFAGLDTANRAVPYASAVKRPSGQFSQHGTYGRHYPGGSTAESDFQRPKAGEYGANGGPDCNVVVPRRPSPLQAHSQASPLGHAPSPAYPMYNSPMNSISSPQQNSNHVST